MFTYTNNILSYYGKEIGKVSRTDIDVLHELLSSVKLEELPKLDMSAYDREEKALSDFERQWRKDKSVRPSSTLCAEMGISMIVYSIAGCSWYLTDLSDLNAGYPLYQLRLLGEFSRSQNIVEGWDDFIASLGKCKV